MWRKSVPLSSLPEREHDCCVPKSKDAHVPGAETEKRKLVKYEVTQEDRERAYCGRTCCPL